MQSPTAHAPKEKASMPQSPIIIAGKKISPGTHHLIELPVASLYTHTVMHLPVHVIHGRAVGPKLFVSAAIHGDELNGVEVIRRLLEQKLLKQLRGTLIAIPFVNSFGMLQHSRYLPDRRDLNRSFPGSEKGSLAARLAHIFLNQIVKHCEYGIDLHTAAINRTNLPQIRANLTDAETRELAQVFGVPVLLNANTRDGSLREAAAEHGIKMLLYEAGEALRFDELSIHAGLRGIINVMRYLQMLRPRTNKSAQRVTEPYIAHGSSWIRAPHSGLLTMHIKLGDRINKDQLLGKVVDPSDMFNSNEFIIISSISGIVIGKTILPLVNEGDAILHIASFEDTGEIAAEVDTFQQLMSQEKL
jgi:uncharacterized protein